MPSECDNKMCIFYPLDNESLCKLAVRQRYGLLDNIHDFIWGSEGSAKWPFDTVRDLFAKSQEPFDIKQSVKVKLRQQAVGADKLPAGYTTDDITWGYDDARESFFTSDGENKMLKQIGLCKCKDDKDEQNEPKVVEEASMHNMITFITPKGNNGWNGIGDKNDATCARSWARDNYILITKKDVNDNVPAMAASLAETQDQAGLENERAARDLGNGRVSLPKKAITRGKVTKPGDELAGRMLEYALLEKLSEAKYNLYVDTMGSSLKQQLLSMHPDAKKKIVWMDCVQVQFDPAGKSTPNTGAGRDLGLTPEGQDVGDEGIKYINKLPDNAQYNSFWSLNLREKVESDETKRLWSLAATKGVFVDDQGTVLTKANVVTAINTAKTGSNLNENDWVESTWAGGTPQNLTLSDDKTKLNKISDYLIALDPQPEASPDAPTTVVPINVQASTNLLFVMNRYVNVSATTDNGAVMMMCDDKGICKIGDKEFAQKSSVVKKKGVLKKLLSIFASPKFRNDLQASSNPFRQAGLQFATKMKTAVAEKATTDHVIAKRLGDAGQALATIGTTNSILATGDRPLLAIAMLYLAPIIMYDGKPSRGTPEYGDSTSIFIRKDLLKKSLTVVTLNNKLTELATSLSPPSILPGGVAVPATGVTKPYIEKAAKTLVTKFTSLMTPLFTMIENIITIIKHYKAKLKEALPAAGNAIYERQKADAYWCLFLICIAYGKPLFLKYQAAVILYKECKDLDADAFGDDLTSGGADAVTPENAATAVKDLIIAAAGEAEVEGGGDPTNGAFKTWIDDGAQADIAKAIITKLSEKQRHLIEISNTIEQINSMNLVCAGFEPSEPAVADDDDAAAAAAAAAVAAGLTLPSAQLSLFTGTDSAGQAAKQVTFYKEAIKRTVAAQGNSTIVPNFWERLNRLNLLFYLFLSLNGVGQDEAYEYQLLNAKGSKYGRGFGARKTLNALKEKYSVAYLRTMDGIAGPPEGDNEDGLEDILGKIGKAIDQLAVKNQPNHFFLNGKDNNELVKATINTMIASYGANPPNFAKSLGPTIGTAMAKFEESDPIKPYATSTSLFSSTFVTQYQKQRYEATKNAAEVYKPVTIGASSLGGFDIVLPLLSDFIALLTNTHEDDDAIDLSQMTGLIRITAELLSNLKDINDKLNFKNYTYTQVTVGRRAKPFTIAPEKQGLAKRIFNRIFSSGSGTKKPKAADLNIWMNSEAINIKFLENTMVGDQWAAVNKQLTDAPDEFGLLPLTAQGGGGMVGGERGGQIMCVSNNVPTPWKAAKDQSKGFTALNCPPTREGENAGKPIVDKLESYKYCRPYAPHELGAVKGEIVRNDAGEIRGKCLQPGVSITNYNTNGTEKAFKGHLKDGVRPGDGKYDAYTQGDGGLSEEAAANKYAIAAVSRSQRSGETTFATLQAAEEFVDQLWAFEPMHMVTDGAGAALIVERSEAGTVVDKGKEQIVELPEAFSASDIKFFTTLLEIQAMLITYYPEGKISEADADVSKSVMEGINKIYTTANKPLVPLFLEGPKPSDEESKADEIDGPYYIWNGWVAAAIVGNWFGKVEGDDAAIKKNKANLTAFIDIINTIETVITPEIIYITNPLRLLNFYPLFENIEDEAAAAAVKARKAAAAAGDDITFFPDNNENINKDGIALLLKFVEISINCVSRHGSASAILQLQAFIKKLSQGDATLVKLNTDTDKELYPTVDLATVMANMVLSFIQQ